MTRSLVLALSLAPLALLGAYALACGDGSHIYEGRRYSTPPGCLLNNESLDVVSGESSTQCSPKCLTQPSDGGRAIFVATTCAPYPFGFDVSGSDPECPQALAAFARNDSCLSDGGSSNPVPAPADAATE